MSTDPYHAVQQEIQSSLQTAATLRASFLRIRSTAREDSEELIWARNEVRAQAHEIRSLEWDGNGMATGFPSTAKGDARGVGSGFGGLGGECEVSRYMPGNAFTNISNRVLLDLTYAVLLNLLVHDCLGWRSRRSLSGDGMWVMSVGKSRYVSGLGVFPSPLLFCSVVSVLMQMLDCR